MSKKLFRAAFISSLPVLMGYLIMGMGFGILLRTKTDLGFFLGNFYQFYNSFRGNAICRSRSVGNYP